jgi:hypothetical protein
MLFLATSQVCTTSSFALNDIGCVRFGAVANVTE